MKLPISKRLLCCASLVPQGARVADVGCDHGYLSIHLLREHIAATAAAMDLRPEPLEAARRNAARFQTADRMEFFLCDGLSALGPGVVDTVVCAGMGGDTMVKILSECSWANDPTVTWILQPQSSGNDLRRWLSERGYRIEREKLVQDGGFLYAVMEVHYGGGVPLTPGQQYVSPQLLEEDPALVRAYIERVKNALIRAVDGLSRAKEDGLAERRAYYEMALRQVRELEEDYENRQRIGTGVV